MCDASCNRARFVFPQTDSNEYRDSVDRVEVIKLPAHSTNGSVLSAPPIYTSSSSSSSSNVNNNINDSDAPLNLSLKPATTSSSSPISGSQPLSQLSNLSQSLLASDRTCKCGNCMQHFPLVTILKPLWCKVSARIFIQYRNCLWSKKS